MPFHLLKIKSGKLLYYLFLFSPSHLTRNHDANRVPRIFARWRSIFNVFTKNQIWQFDLPNCWRCSYFSLFLGRFYSPFVHQLHQPRARYYFFHTPLMSTSSHQPANSIFLSHHSSTSHRLQPSKAHDPYSNSKNTVSLRLSFTLRCFFSTIYVYSIYKYHLEIYILPS